jgi:catechol 2,3-dioxygenase-like lactoylglutathione lyase family enzyme
MLKLEVLTIAVSDIDRAVDFYVNKVGFVLDVDYQPTQDFRVVQLTPPGSACSIQLVKASATGGSQSVLLVTSDLAAEQERLVGKGVNIANLRRKHPWETWSGGWAEGIDPHRRNYASFADFSDPDGNLWTLQERGFVNN